MPSPKKFATVGVILYLLLGCSCAQLFQALPPESSSQATLRSDAELLFLKGEYNSALQKFARVYENRDLAAEDRNQALYGLACTQIVMARSHSELVEGIGNLQKWDEEKGTAPFIENRRLLIFALKQQGETQVKRTREQQRQETRQDRLIAEQKEQIARLTQTIEGLREQLEALEAIDEDFQEKKKTL